LTFDDIRGFLRAMSESHPGNEKKAANDPAPAAAAKPPAKVPETGGPKGPEPTRYGDWERGGLCIDF
jgi:hypothetical protein